MWLTKAPDTKAEAAVPGAKHLSIVYGGVITLI